jgi:hypothetical protein
MIKYIKYNNKTLAIIIGINKNKSGLNFYTPENLSHQVGFMKYKKNHLITPHVHFKNLRTVDITSEVLILTKGKLRVDFYSNSQKYLFSETLIKNQIIILISGGHGFKSLSPIEMLEIKQGPYSKKKDKKTFSFIDEKKIKWLK